MVLAALLPATAAAAQTAPTTSEAPRTIPGLTIGAPVPGATQTPVPVPTDAVRGLSLPKPAATPSVVPTPRPSATRIPAAPIPRAEAPVERHATPSPTPTPEARPTPALSPPAGVSLPVPVATPTAVASQRPATTTVAPTAVEPARPWGWIAAGVLVLLAFAGGMLVRRRRSPPVDDAPVAGDAPPSPPAMVRTPEPVAVPFAPAASRARVEIALQPSRAGLNMLSAVVEAVVVVANRGTATAADVRIHPSLLSAHAGQETDLAAAFAAPIGRPATPPFTLQPGEERRVRIVAALPRDAVRSMEAGGRPMFVPLLAIDLRYVADGAGTPGRTGRAFVVGIERVDSAKLAPFWLDGPLRMHDQIAARPHGAVLEE